MKPHSKWANILCISFKIFLLIKNAEKRVAISHGQGSGDDGDGGVEDGLEAVDDETVETLEADDSADDDIQAGDEDRGDEAGEDLVLETHEAGADGQGVEDTQSVAPDRGPTRVEEVQGHHDQEETAKTQPGNIDQQLH